MVDGPFDTASVREVPGRRQVRHSKLKRSTCPRRCMFRIMTLPPHFPAESAARDDAELARQAAAGDATAMTILLERHFDYIHAICLRMLRDRHAAEDARQEVLYRIASRIRSFDQQSSFRTWAFAIARNVILNEIRARNRVPMPAGIPDTVTAEPGEPQADARLDISAALDGLSAARREVIVLRYLCDLSYREIADVTGIPLNTVRTRLRRALGDLRVILGNSPDSTGVKAWRERDPLGSSSD
jgi:RNA polymerase sigma factor (sigma-70 family)